MLVTDIDDQIATTHGLIYPELLTDKLGAKEEAWLAKVDPKAKPDVMQGKAENGSRANIQ